MPDRRALLVGAGGMGRAWARNLRDTPGATLAGWVDVSQEALDASIAEVGVEGVQTATDLSDAIDRLEPEFVVDVTPPEVHRDVVVTALDRDLPVIGEKPMAHSLEAARDMVAASERNGKLYMVSQSRRYNAQQEAYKKAVGAIGKLGILNVDFFLGPHFGGFRDAMPSPLVLDMAIHTFDQARYLSGADPVGVYCEEFNPGWSWYDGDACANALFEMSDGTRFCYRGSWCAEGLDTSWEGQWRAVGSLGSATWDGHAEIRSQLGDPKSSGFFRKQEERKHPIEADGFFGGIAGSLREFLNALDTGQTPMGECKDNIKSLAMVFGAMASARSGKRVKIENDRLLD